MKKDSLVPERCQRLKELRGKRTQKEMSALLGVTEKTYRSWENGEYRKGDAKKTYPQPDLDRLIKMSNLFECSIDYLLCRSNCTSVDNHYISLKTGLSDKAINQLFYIKCMNEVLGLENDLDLSTINTLIEQLKHNDNNNIIHAITSYLRSTGLQEDVYYSPIDGRISKNRTISLAMNSVRISANSNIFDSLLLMDIQKRLIDLKAYIQKAPDTD